MTDLPHLPEDVREAVEQFDCVTMHGAKWRLFRDYILSVTAERDALAKRIADAPVAIMDTRVALGVCAPTEDDFPGLYALQGSRVKLVKVE